MRLALLVALGVLFVVAPVARAQDDDEDLDAELGDSGAYSGGAPQMSKEDQERMQQHQAFMRHLLESVTEPCRDEIMAVMQLPPEEQKSKVRNAT